MNLLYVWPLPADLDNNHWDVAADDPSRRTHTEINACLFPGQRTGFSGSRGAVEALDIYHPDFVITLLPWEAHPVECRAHMLALGRECRRRGIIATIQLDDIHGSFLNAEQEFMFWCFDMFDQYDALLCHYDYMLQTCKRLTSTPAYRWRAASELCRQLHDKPYPDGERDLISVRVNHRGAPERASKGAAHSILVAAELVRRFPDYTFHVCTAGADPQNLIDIREDRLLSRLGLTETMLMPAFPFDWHNLAAALTRSKLVVNLDGSQVRGQFNYEAAACGTPIIATDVPQSSQDLGIGVSSALCMDDALELGTQWLSDPISWDVESRRVHALSKQYTMGATRRVVGQIFAAAGKTLQPDGRVGGL